MEKKFVPLLVTSIITFAFIALLMILGLAYYANPEDAMWAPETAEIFIPFIPGPVFTDLLIIVLVSIIGFFIFYALAPILAKLLIKIHKIFSRIGTDAKYGVVRTGEKVTGRMLFFRAMVVSFFTFSLAAFFVEMLTGLGISEGFLLYTSTSPYLDKIIQVFVACLFLGIITIFIFLPVWHLEDSGLTSLQVSTSKEDERSPVDIQGVHAPIAGVLSGYAGIATVLAWILFIVDVLANPPYAYGTSIMVIFFILLPFIVAGFFSIPIYLYEKKLPKLISRLESNWNYEYYKPPMFEKIES